MFDMQCIMFVRMRSDIDAEWLCIVLGAIIILQLILHAHLTSGAGFVYSTFAHEIIRNFQAQDF